MSDFAFLKLIGEQSKALPLPYWPMNLRALNQIGQPSQTRPGQHAIMEDQMGKRARKETMGSKKRSARAREVADFKSQLENGLGGLDDLFANEERREQKREADHDAAMRWKSCEKKNRYATRDEAEEARKWCEDRGTRGLEIYRCEYCGGWHLTSHPFE